MPTQIHGFRSRGGSGCGLNARAFASDRRAETETASMNCSRGMLAARGGGRGSVGDAAGDDSESWVCLGLAMDTLLRYGAVQVTLRSYAPCKDSSIAGELVVIGAGEIEAAAGFGAEKLAPALLKSPAA